MQRVGAFEAKTHLSKLLERVARGERITIEKHGVPVAVLEPPKSARKKPAKQAIAELKQFRAGRSLGGLSVREMIEEGRR
jgi:prevent-host-death family protein